MSPGGSRGVAAAGATVSRADSLARLGRENVGRPAARRCPKGADLSCDHTVVHSTKPDLPSQWAQARGSAKLELRHAYQWSVALSEGPVTTTSVVTDDTLSHDLQLVPCESSQLLTRSCCDKGLLLSRINVTQAPRYPIREHRHTDGGNCSSHAEDKERSTSNDSLTHRSS